MTTAMLYWITRLDGIVLFFGTLTFVSTVISVTSFIALVWSYAGGDEENVIGKLKKWIVGSVMASLSFFLVAVLVPDTKAMAAILVIPRVVNSETAMELGDGVKDLALQWLEELKPRKGACGLGKGKK